MFLFFSDNFAKMLNLRCSQLRSSCCAGDEGGAKAEVRVRGGEGRPVLPAGRRRREAEGLREPWLRGSMSNLSLIFQPNEETL